MNRDTDRGASKKRLIGLLLSTDLDRLCLEWSRRPPLPAINSLFPLLYSGDARVKTRAVTMMGRLVAGLALEDMEQARNVIRRIMWNLNDESGGIGWGSPEAMGEILARHGGLATEYGRILVSYTLRDGNFLENELLQKGLLWAILRVWEAQRSSVPESTHRHIPPFLESPSAGVRGLAAELLGHIGDRGHCHALAPLLSDEAEYEKPMEEWPVRRRVREAAAEAMERLGCAGDDR